MDHTVADRRVRGRNVDSRLRVIDRGAIAHDTPVANLKSPNVRNSAQLSHVNAQVIAKVNAKVEVLDRAVLYRDVRLGTGDIDPVAACYVVPVDGEAAEVKTHFTCVDGDGDHGAGYADILREVVVARGADRRRT